MGNKIDKIESLDIHTRGVNGKYCFVLVTDYDNLEPHIGELNYTKDSEIHAIVKALEYIDFIKIQYNPIRIYTSSQAAIEFIQECIYNKRKDRLVQKILLLLSNKDIRFLHINFEENQGNAFINA